MPRPASAAWISAAVAIVVAALWLHWSPLDANDLIGGDEGYYGTLARNLLNDRGQWISPSLTPLGPPGDKPPLYPALLALSVAALGPFEPALRWPSILMAVWIAIATGILAARAIIAVSGSEGGGGAASPGRMIAWLAAPVAAAMLVTLPWYGDASRSAMSDIPLTACGCAALLVITSRTPTARRAAWAGVLLGLAFQCKLWLAGVFGLPAAVALLPIGATRREAPGVRRPAGWAPLATMSGAAVVVASLHLITVAIGRPGDLPHWWSVYWQRMVVERVTDVASPYARPGGYYLSLLAHALVLVAPLAGLGLDRLTRRWREPAPSAVLAWCATSLALSAFTVKSAVYLYSLLPGWVVAATVGAASLAAGTARPRLLTLVVAAAGAPWVIRRLGGEPTPFGPWAALWGLALAATWLAARRPAMGVAAAALLALLAIAGGLWRESRRLPLRYHDPGFRVVARALAPRLADRPPGRTSFVAPEAPAFAAYLFRTGRYWGTPRAPWRAGDRTTVAADTALRVFIVDPTQQAYGGWPDSATLGWLESSTREVTGAIEREAGRPIAVRVFVRRDPVERGAE
jgi:4-amino-4-deoxy-L-arabinose transferase-like glycosyltransferase